MNYTYLYLFLALLAGAMMPTQAAVNNKMAAFVESPVLSAFISFLVGTAALFLYILASGVSLGNLASAREAPAVAWIGGLLGAFFVAVSVMLLPKLGVAMTFSLIIAGQMLITLVIDHFGLLGVPVKEISIPRIVGVFLIASGVVLIRRF
ncbi:MAG: DMT family transporter [Pyrinomonadaceae bacterium]|nr:DMT family transporter [Blastocatellia bacterium]MDQ3219971.1 DMT family transporter [Acidobacteriota bacterium]